MADKTVIHVIDDDAAMRDSLAFLLDVNGFRAEVFTSRRTLSSRRGDTASPPSCVSLISECPE